MTKLNNSSFNIGSCVVRERTRSQLIHVINANIQDHVYDKNTVTDITYEHTDRFYN